MEKQAAELWSYYKSLAENLGTVKSKEDGQVTQSAFSLAWFFSKTPEEKAISASEKPDDTLLLSFLGDSDARKRLCERFESARSVALDCDWPNPKRAPNDSQKLAIQAALHYPISFIQGPPGTGKTATILNLLSRIIGEGKTAAVVSCNNTALDNIISDLPKYGLEGKVARLGKQENRKKFYIDNKDRLPLPEAGTAAGQDKIRGMTFAAFRAGRKGDNGFPVFTSTLHSLQKCFRDGETCQYDYVIMDEASQVPVLCGLIALASAKNLVVVGDEKQLSAFISKDDGKKLNGILPPQEAELYRIDKGESNFLSLSLNVFLGPCRKGKQTEEDNAVLPSRWVSSVCTFLDQHYRCHPGIIEFCNESFYDGKLNIVTPEYDPSVSTPIRVLWYNGDYCEGAGAAPDSRPEEEAEQKLAEEQEAPEKKQKRTESAKRYNGKQVTLFVEEEWPRLLKRLRAKKDLSVCILAPFGNQLEALSKALKERFATHEEERQELELIVEKSEEDKKSASGKAQSEEEPEIPFPMLTIHKAQGREYDVVYLLPTEDAANWTWPWSQGERLINVAVSRAKGELCLIVSSLLMDNVTRESLGLPSLPRMMCPGQEKKADLDAQRQLCIQKLVAYARERELRQIVEKTQEEADWDYWGLPQDPHWGLKLDGETRTQQRQEYIQMLTSEITVNGNEALLTAGADAYGFHQTSRASIFDEMYRIKWMVKGLARQLKREAYSEELRSRYGLWSPERIVELTLRRLCKREGLRLYREVSAQDLATASGTPMYTEKELYSIILEYEKEEEKKPTKERFSLLDPGETAEARAERFFRHSRFDFAICDKQGRLLLIVEADGEYHRSSERCRKNDTLKNRVVTHLLGGAVFLDNMGCLDAVWEEGRSVRLLRLPNDGRTWLETEQLREALRRSDPGSSLLEDSFSIEELVRKCMACPVSEKDVYVKADFRAAAEEKNIRENALWGLCELQYLAGSEIEDQGGRVYLRMQKTVCNILRGETDTLSREKRELTKGMLFFRALADCSEEEVRQAIAELKKERLIRLEQYKEYHAGALTLALAPRKGKTDK